MSLKRIFDIAAGSAGLVLTSPLILGAALASAVVHRDNPIFTQKRVGMNGELFTIFKIKSMHDKYDRNGDTLADKERVTTFGKILRSSRIDELPQFINIIKGDMSMVGPRPIMPKDNGAYDEVRTSVRPGCTGLAQIFGHKKLTYVQRLKCDREYVQKFNERTGFGNLINDIGIILRTPFHAIKFGTGPS